LELERLLKPIDVCSPDPKAIVSINKMIPCILHLEIQVGIKIFSMIVSQGLSAQANRKDRENFVTEVEKLVNPNILGTHLQLSRWFFTVEEKEIDGEKIRLVLGEVH
jgi:hypothetical protein